MLGFSILLELGESWGVNLSESFIQKQRNFISTILCTNFSLLFYFSIVLSPCFGYELILLGEYFFDSTVSIITHSLATNAPTNFILYLLVIERHDVGSAGNIFIEVFDRNLQDKDI